MKRLNVPRIGKRMAFGAGALLLAVPLAVGTVVGTAQARPGAAGNPGSPAPTVNWALSGTATATSEESGDPAANAIDGDAGQNPAGVCQRNAAGSVPCTIGG